MKLYQKIITGVILAAAAGFIGQQVNAGERQATVTHVETYYSWVNKWTPVRECTLQDKPIYESRRNNDGDILLGLILGGVSGKVITGDDKGAIAGSVIGGVIGANNGRKKITGYKTIEVCDTVNKKTKTKQIDGYLVTFKWKGIRGEANTNRKYHVGEKIPVMVNLYAM